MGSFTTEVPTSAAGAKPKRGAADTLENEAIGLDVSVRIHGSQVTAVVLDTTEHVEPFEEDTSTMIVFPRGAVVKLRARVRTGHAVVLTHLTTKQTALCRIIQVNSAANVSHYVKLEFIQPVPGFWGVPFPSEASAPAAHEEHAKVIDELEKLAAPSPPVKSAPPVSVPPAPRPLPQIDSPHPAPKPFAREAVQEPVKPVPAPPVSYGISEDARKHEVVPLAAAPTKRAPMTPKTQAPIPAPLRTVPSPATEAPIFDSLSTGEEVFGKEATVTSEDDERAILKSDQRAAQAFGRSLDPSSLLHGGEAPKRHTGLKIFLSVAAVALLAAGAVHYVRQYRGNTRQSLSLTTPVNTPPTSPATPNASATQTATQSPAPAAAETEPPSEGRPAAKHVPVQAPPEQTAITIVPVHNNTKISDPEGQPAASNGMAHIYAGDLAARPQATQHNNVTVDAPLPAINSNPKELTGVSTNAQLGSLIAGASSTLPTPPKPAGPVAVVRGGQVVSPRLLHGAQPSYPALARSNHVEGDVQIQAVIDQTGKVTSTRVISGPALLRDSAMDAVRQWKYSPATLDGKPITMQYRVTVRFRLGQ